MVAFGSALDQGAVLSSSAEGAAIELRAMAGFDPGDYTSLKDGGPDYKSLHVKSIDGKTMGLPREFFGEGVNTEVAGVVEDALAQLRAIMVACMNAACKQACMQQHGMYIFQLYEMLMFT